MENNIVLVTGATAGIGEATARQFAQNGSDLIITGRRHMRLERLQKEFEEMGVKVWSLCFDIRNREATEEAINNLPDEWKEIDILVNNAGLAAGLDPLHNGDVEDWEKMIDTNIKGLLYITRLVSKGMVERK
ncbi:MAG: SDR family NAD(P)-dependent oxidoreductase, partial [Bacteroidetes bacterium]|nr:SDR family NAD(P)-dependent oxidoreductase [Bacteroidota bacterium]